MPIARRINAPGVARLPAFSHAVRAGDFLFLSGMLGTRADSFELVDGGVGAQTRQALDNIGKILAAAGADFDDLVNLKVFLVDMTRFGDMNEAYGAFFPGDPPSRITVGCNALALGAAIEIEAVAYLPAGR
jgi:2-iminobutanoate/2-iminopropanoate deaminase